MYRDTTEHLALKLVLSYHKAMICGLRGHVRHDTVASAGRGLARAVCGGASSASTISREGLSCGHLLSVCNTSLRFIHIHKGARSERLGCLVDQGILWTSMDL